MEDEEIPDSCRDMLEKYAPRAEQKWCLWDDGDIGVVPTDTGYSAHIANSGGFQSYFLIETHNRMLDEKLQLQKELEKALSEIQSLRNQSNNSSITEDSNGIS